MANNTDILRALAQEATAIKTNDGPDPAEKKTGFFISLYEYPDIIITRETPKIKRQLVLMPSAEAAFIKIEKNGKDMGSEALTANNYAAFATGINLKMPDGFWMDQLTGGTRVGSRLCEVFSDKLLMEILKKGILPKDINLMDPYSRQEGPIVNAYKAYPKLIIEFNEHEKVMQLLLTANVFCSEIVKRFGLNNARDFFNEYDRSLSRFNTRARYNSVYDITCDDFLERHNVNSWEMAENGGVYESVSNRHYGHSCYSEIPGCNMKYSSFRDYVIYESFRMGFGLNIEAFFEEWIDTLNLQYEIYGKIREKYPDDLPTMHNQLLYKRTVMKEEIDEKKFAAHAEEAKKYEGKYKGFSFIAPTCRQDFIDEATMQNNCLAGYINRFIDGLCIIIFMRKKDDPARSYITVELVNGKINQAKYARNRELSNHDLEILAEWIDRCNKS